MKIRKLVFKKTLDWLWESEVFGGTYMIKGTDRGYAAKYLAMSFSMPVDTYQQAEDACNEHFQTEITKFLEDDSPKCHSCGTPLSLDCEDCRRLWAS